LLIKRNQMLPLAVGVAAAALVLLASSATAATWPPASLDDAEEARLAPLQEPADQFQRLIDSVAEDIRQAEQERQRQAVAAARAERQKYERLPGGVTMETLDAIAACESGGYPTVVSADGSYRGLYQFDFGTWESVGGHGDPAQASAAEQSYRAALLYSRSGSSPWPVCG
jgi:TolA-binding protein